jgi:hypothetical protein
LLSISIPGVFCGEVVLTAVGLINTILSSYILVSPFESCMGMSLIILSLEFSVVLVSFFVFM